MKTLIENDEYKITIEELESTYITTFWDKNLTLEVDRQVFEFETYGGAIDRALELLTDNTNFNLIRAYK